MKNNNFKDTFLNLILIQFLILLSCNSPQPIKLHLHTTLGKYGCDHNITETLNGNHLLKRTIITNNLKFNDAIIHPPNTDTVTYKTVYVDIDTDKFNTINDSIRSYYMYLKENNIPIIPDSLKVGFNEELYKFFFSTYLKDNLTLYYGKHIIYGK